MLRFSMENSCIKVLLRSKTLVVRDGVYSSISYTGGRPEKIYRINTAHKIINTNSPASAEKIKGLEVTIFFSFRTIFLNYIKNTEAGTAGEISYPFAIVKRV